ncbi:MAG TPA: hypothetical protein VF533_02365 [Solirubrobacteraceae bacterium]|jgi:DNA-binding MarR family transcriptional regulator
MPLDEAPKLVSMMGAIERAVIAELYARLEGAGFTGLSHESAAIFQFIRPGGSPVEEIARLAQATPEAVAEQVRLLAAAGYATASAGQVSLTDRGRAAAEAGLAALDEIEAGWRRALGGEGFGALAAGLARLNLRPIPG